MQVAGRLVAHVETWRPYTTCYPGLVGLAGAALTDPHAGVFRLVCAWAIPTLGWIAGLYGGDYFDRELDAQAKPYRPIPSGRLPARLALAVLIVVPVVGGAVGLWLNWRTVLLVVAALVTGIAYSKVFKARGLAGNAVRGLITVFALIFGALCVADHPSWRLIPVAAAFWLHDIGSNLVGTLRDVDGDRAGGYRTLPVVRGMGYAIRVVLGCFVLCYGYALLATVWLPTNRLFPFLVVPAAVGAVLALGLLREDPLTRPTALRSHEHLVLERVVLAGSFVTLGLGWPGVPITVVVLIVAWSTQNWLRARYEFAASDPAAVTAVDVLAFVDEQLSELQARGPLSALADWHRLIHIELTDPELQLSLEARAGLVQRAETPATDVDAVRIRTTGAVFADIFLHGRSNPRRAYLTRKLAMDASPRDMMLLNQLFNQFRSNRPSGWTVTEAPAERPAEITAQVVVSDTTLRDGEQMPGVRFSPAIKVELARRLHRLGVPLIEVGFPAVSEEERDAVRRIVDAGLDTMIQVIARPHPADIRAAIESGAHSIAVFVGTSPAHLTHKLRLTPDQAMTRVAAAIRQVKQAGRQAVFAAEDATRTDPGQLARFYAAAADAGADALGLADTAGSAQPAQFQALVAAVGQDCPLPLAVHCHNDLGLATANSLAGLLGGASGVQCSVLGIGERAGNAPLEQVALCLETGFDRRTGLDLAELEPLAGYVGSLIGTPVPPFMPVVGGHAFVHESGLHVDGITRDPSTYEPYSPDLVGRTRRIVLGKHSGRSAVRAVAEQHHLTLSDDEAERVLTRVKSGGFDTAELADIIREQLSERAVT